MKQLLGSVVQGAKAPLMMVIVQVAFAGVNIFYKLAANDGMNLTLVVAYRFVFATAFMAPLAFVLERKKRPKLTWIVLVQLFFCALFGGSLGQNLYLKSLAMTSATYASAMANLIPAITFILAVCLGLEKLSFGTVAGKAKVTGTLMGVCGAMLLTFYKGVEVNPWSTHVNLLHHPDASHVALAPSHDQAGPSNRLRGSILAVASCVSYSLWLILQAKVSEKYPCQYTSTALLTFMGSMQSLVYALCRERDWEQWKLGWNIRLLTVSYSGIVGSGLCYTLLAWCVRMRGPVFVSIFNPLMLVMVALAGSLVLDEKLHLGSILGAGLIVLGLYAVIWGKSKEFKRMTQLVPTSLSSGEPEAIEIVVTSPERDDVSEGGEKRPEPMKEASSLMKEDNRELQTAP